MIKRAIIFLTPNKLQNGQEIAEDLQDYYLTVYALPSSKELSFQLANIQKKTQFEYRTTFSHLNLKYEYSQNPNKLVRQDITGIPENLDQLRSFSDTIIAKFHIVEHILTLKESEPPLQRQLSKKEIFYVPPSSRTETKKDVPYHKIPNFQKEEQKILKLQALFRGRLVREQYNLLKMKPTRVLAVTMIRSGSSLVTLKIIENMKTKETYVYGFDSVSREQYEKILLPKALVQIYASNLQELLKQVAIVIHK